MNIAIKRIYVVMLNNEDKCEIDRFVLFALLRIASLASLIFFITFMRLVLFIFYIYIIFFYFYAFCLFKVLCEKIFLLLLFYIVRDRVTFDRQMSQKIMLKITFDHHRIILKLTIKYRMRTST